MKFFSELGLILIFLADICEDICTEGVDKTLASLQVIRVFKESLLTSAQAGFFVGAISTIQFSVQVKQFDALSYLGALTTSGTLRETGPLLIAFMLSGKVGAFTSAELGTLRITEQIDALRCLGANPLQEIIVPRFIGIVIASIFLLIVGLFTSMFGSYFLAYLFHGLSLQEYIRFIPQIVNYFSLLSGMIKCLVFSFVLATVCTYYGYHATGGAKGVGSAVVKTATITLISIVIADWFTSFLGDIILSVGVNL